MASEPTFHLCLEDVHTHHLVRSPALSSRAEAESWLGFFKDAAIYHFIWIAEGSDDPIHSCAKTLAQNIDPKDLWFPGRLLPTDIHLQNITA